MAASYHHISKLTRLLSICTYFLAVAYAQTAGVPGTMPSPVGNPGPPAVPNIASPQNNGWYGIKQWTSLGDSYATGVGVGTSLAWNRCVHFSDAYPRLMTADARMPGEWGDQRILWDCTCSGATTQDILDHQFLDQPESDPIYGDRSIFGNPQIATLTAGGDDVEFLWLILYCVLQFFKNNPCQEQIARSQEIIDSPLLYNSLDYVIKNALIKGITAAGPGFKLFVTGYAQFFNETSTQCDNTCFSYWDPECDNSIKLEQSLRQQLNTLAINLNQKIQDVVKNNAAWDVEYVSYDDQFEGHRFCEGANTEPDDNNPNIWFFHLNTAGNGRTQTIDDSYAAILSGNNNAADFYSAIKTRSATVWATDLDPNQNESAAYDLLFSVGDTSDVSIQNALSGYIRIFHPTGPGIDTIETQIFNAFPNWPPADPPPVGAQGQSSSTVAPPPSTIAPVTPPTPPPYATGTCSLHVDEYQNCLDDSKNLYAVITIYDSKHNVIGQTPTNATYYGAPINTGDPYSMTSKLADPLVVVGEHENDYIQFTLGSLSWTSRSTQAPYFASNGGWNPRDGPVCTRFGNQNAENQVDSSFPC